MKKKGRICGTIGLVLSLVLAGGTVVYGTMFHQNAAGSAKSPVGDSTGNYFVSWVKRDGFGETKKLIDESFVAVSATSEENATYKSYTLDYSTTATYKADDGTTSVYMQKATVYVDESYTYLKTFVRGLDGGEVEADAYEYIFVKETGKVYFRTNAVLTESAADAPLLDTSAWAVDTEGTYEGFAAFGVAMTQTVAAFDAAGSEGSSVELRIDFLTGEYFFEDRTALSAFDEGSTAEYRFTVGIAPTVRYSLSGKITDEEKKTSEVNYTYTLGYSCLNNTKVNIPDSLAEILEGEASK